MRQEAQGLQASSPKFPVAPLPMAGKSLHAEHRAKVRGKAWLRMEPLQQEETSQWCRLRQTGTGSVHES